MNHNKMGPKIARFLYNITISKRQLCQVFQFFEDCFKDANYHHGFLNILLLFFHINLGLDEKKM